MSQMTQDVNALRGKLATEIPVTQHLGLEVVRSDRDGLVLAAPLARNINHEGTAFAGSVNALATLAGWGWTWLALRQASEAAQVVLQDSSIRYLRPIESDFVAHCLPAESEEVERMFLGLTRHRRGRITLNVNVRVGDAVVATFRGRYVARKTGG